MDKEFFENKDGCNSNQIISHEEVVKKLASMTEEEAKAEIGEMLEEITSVMEFMKDRFADITDKHQALSCTGALGLVAGVSFCGKPITFAGVGTRKALDNTFKVIMMGMVSHEN